MILEALALPSCLTAIKNPGKLQTMLERSCAFLTFRDDHKSNKPT